MEEILFKKDNNLMFSKFNNIELKELFIELKNYYLTYRDNLNLPHNLTFGTELEYDYMLKILYDDFLSSNLPNWTSKTELSLLFGGEIVSPIMSDNNKTWTELKLVCDYLNKNHAITKISAGGHIHIGANILDNNIEAWKIFLKLYMCYEHILFRFGYGDKINPRKSINIYSTKCFEKLYDNLKYIEESKTLEDLHYTLDDKDNKYNALNFNNLRFNEYFNSRIHTIEFRFPNASSNEIIWQNNINTFSKMILASLNNNIDEEFLNYKIEEIYDNYSELKYNIIVLEDALEFVDLIFNNNLDKMYFLRQYFKNFEYSVERNYGFHPKNFTLR